MEHLLSQIRVHMEAEGFCPEWVESLPILANDLDGCGVRNIPAWLRELKPRLSDKEQYLDVWAQGWFALVLAHNRYVATMNPLGNSGPDLLVQVQGHDMYVEVRRFVADYDERRRLEKTEGIMVRYGDLSKDVGRVLDAIQHKSRQGQDIPTSASYVVAIRSDKESIEEVEFQCAVQEMEQEAAAGGGQYSAIGSVLFYHGYVNVTTGKRWYVWRNPNAAPGRFPPNAVSQRLEMLSLPPAYPRPPYLKSPEQCG